MTHGKIVNLPTVEGIPILENEDDYKYLGLLQTNKVLHDASKTSELNAKIPPMQLKLTRYP